MLRGDLAKVNTEAARSGPNASGWVSGLKEARKQLAGFVAAYASIRTLGALAKVSDEATAISGRLRVATKTQEEFNAAQDETFDIAQRTRSSWTVPLTPFSVVNSTASPSCKNRSGALRGARACSWKKSRSIRLQAR